MKSSKQMTIRARLFLLFSIVFIISTAFLTFQATQMVTRFGEFSATENETSIRSQAGFFLSQITYEKAMKCENVFKRIAVSSAYLAKHASVNLGMESILGNIARPGPETMIQTPQSKLYANLPIDPVMVLYWGEEKIHSGILTHLNALSHIDPLLKTVVDQNPEAVACFITFEKATTRYYPNFPSVIRDLSEEAYEIRDSAWYTAVKPENNPERKTVWAEVYQDPAGRGLMTTAVTPVYDKKEAFIGAAGVDVTLTNITDIILTVDKREHPVRIDDMFSFIIDATGRIVAFPEAYSDLFGFENAVRQKNTGYNALFNLRLTDSERPEVRHLWAELLSGPVPRQKSVAINGNSLLISYYIMPSTGWRLGVAVPEPNLLKSIQETRQAMKSMVGSMMVRFGFFAVIVIVISIVGFTILSFRYFISPLDELIKASLSVTEGDFSQQVRVRRKDEIGILAQTFNSMVTELKNLNIREKEYSSQLQQKVKERTLELEEKSLQQEKTLTLLQQEIRERKEVEHQLSRSEEKYRDIFNNSVQGIFQSSTDSRIINVNPSMARILGYDSTLDFLTHIKDLARQVYVHPGQREIFINLLRKNDFVSGFETQLKKKDGTPVWVSICGRGVKDKEGNILYIQGAFEDISERKKAEAIFNQAKKMAEDASRAKGEFLAIMSHEIRTPLNAIIGMTRLALSTPMNPTQKEYLDAVLISSDHLLALLNSILDFSKIEAGKFVLDNKIIDIESLLNEMLVMFSYQAKKKGLSLNYSTRDVPKYVKGDSHRLRQILVNLVGNAIKFTHQGSIAIDVQARLLDQKKSAGPEKVLLQFSIKDTGIGIPNDKLSVIFNDFTQLNDSVGSETGGTGLGLTITKQLISLMDGNIWVESQEGKGSIFCFNITLIKASQDEIKNMVDEKTGDSSVLPARRVYTPLKILVAEDFEVNQKLIVPFLSQHGHRVITAGNGREVLDHLSKEDFDIILMDIKMPIMDGVETTRQIRSHALPGISEIPIIALTAHAIKGDREKFINAGMDDYLSKPVDGEALLELLEQFSKMKPNIKKNDMDEKICNLDHTLTLMGGNTDIALELCKTIVVKFPEALNKIKKAIECQDADTVTMTAHALKSGARTLDAKGFLTLIEFMEQCGKNQDFKSAADSFKQFENVSNQIAAELMCYINYGEP